MTDSYVEISRIHDLLQRADKEDKPIYISAPVGMGKTEAVHYYYRKQAVLWLDCENESAWNRLLPASIPAKTVVFDNLSFLKDEQSKAYLKEMILSGQKHIVMMGRSGLPEWLKSTCVKKQFLITEYQDLQMTNTEIRKLLQLFQVKAEADTICQIAQDTKGHALTVVMTAYRMQGQSSYTQAIREAAQVDTYPYYDEHLFAKWRPAIQTLLLQLCNFEAFTIELAEVVSDHAPVFSLLHEVAQIGGFLTRNEDGSYQMWKKLREYLLWKQALLGSDWDRRLILQRAAFYYEKKHQILEALHCYQQIGDEEAVIRLLIQNAKEQVGSGPLYQTRQYYLALPEEQILKYPALMSGISMLYSLLMQPSRSDYWYERLLEYEKKPELTREEKKEAGTRRLYLDIALPHRGTVNIIDVLKKTAPLVTKKQIEIPDFSVTSNLPSIMNGGLDFSEWSKSDKLLARVMKNPVELLLKDWGAGLVNISLAESFFEKGTEDPYKIIALLNSGYTKADLGGRIEMCFVADAVLCRIYVRRNLLPQAMEIMGEFKRKVWKEKAVRIIPNLEAMENWFELLQDHKQEITLWTDTKAPNENQEFFVMYRYQYMMKIRSYITLNRLDEAANLIERISIYFREYHRTYYEMEIELLRAIVQYRMKLGDFRKTLSAVLPRIEEYHFIDLIAKEGIAIREVLQQVKKLPVSEAFYSTIMTAIDEMALAFPNYLRQERQAQKLTGMEKKILTLYKQGISAEKICDLNCISYNTLKYHSKNIYRKLGVHNRAEAERLARERNL